MPLNEYKKKRTKNTPEPMQSTKDRNNLFVVQKHDATNLHYDFRFSHRRTLKSWAIPKGPSMRSGEKRLAMQTEDHPLDYADFEGTIPEGEYGAGKVIVWDQGTYENISGNSMDKSIKEGNIKLNLSGQKLKGTFALVHMKGKGKAWLFIKKDDRYATDKDITKKAKSVKSGKTIKQIKG